MRPTRTGEYSFDPTNEPAISVPPLVESMYLGSDGAHQPVISLRAQCRPADHHLPDVAKVEVVAGGGLAVHGAVTTAAPRSITSARVRAATCHTAPDGWLGLPS